MVGRVVGLSVTVTIEGSVIVGVVASVVVSAGVVLRKSSGADVLRLVLILKSGVVGIAVVLVSFCQKKKLKY
jgi:hypothetical protein